MGSFLTNVQVKTAGPAKDALDRIAELLTVTVGLAGFTPVESATGADRSIVVVAHSGKEWIGIYDQFSEDQAGGHEALAEELSRDLKAPVVSVLVHDSDVLNMKLFDSGRTLDDFSNWPGYFEGGEEIAKGKASAWAP